MKTLQELREIIIENFETSMLVPQLAAMHSILSNALLKTPIANFEQGYESFIKSIADQSAHYDAWLVTVYDVMAATGKLTDIVKELNEITENLRKNFPGGQALSYDFDEKDPAFIIAFAFRITLALATAKVVAETDDKKDS